MPVRLLIATQGQAANTLYWGTQADENSLLGFGQADTQIEKASDYSTLTRIVTAAAATVSRNAQTYIMNLGTAQTLTMNASGFFPIGTVITVVQIGAGAFTIVAGTGVTVSTSAATLVSKGQWNVAQLIKTGAMTWVAFGGIG